MKCDNSLMIIVPSLKSGGLERVASLLANGLAKRGLEIELICPYRMEPYYNLDKDLNVKMPSPNIKNLPKILRGIYLFFWLRMKISKSSIKTILSFGEGYNAFYIASALGLSKRFFVSNRASPLSSLTGNRRNVNPFFYKFTQGVLVQTERAKELLQPVYKKSRFKVVPNPFYIPHNDEISQEKDNIILNVGSIGGKKNQELLIRYFSKINNNKDWKIYFIGDGPKKENCRNLTKELGIADQVFFTGAQKDVAKFYNKAKIFAFTSTSEGFPNALGEALSYGLPVVSFDCITGPSELIDDGQNGFLIDEFDENQYINKLSMLMEDETLRLKFSQNARNKMKKYDYESILSKYIEVLFER
jgi:GalNAc-alpha-(1->4)-GalNAc-alpha-(1->3)-diNAcBac-PP-undecaprenol alpha-1,4-N-acetyl-D-galactosaminyltransferase